MGHFLSAVRRMGQDGVIIICDAGVVKHKR
jgi:hypothetical protein